MVIQTVTVPLAKHLHDTHHQAETWDSCSPACRKFYLTLADSALTYLLPYIQVKEREAMMRGRMKG